MSFSAFLLIGHFELIGHFSASTGNSSAHREDAVHSASGAAWEVWGRMTRQRCFLAHK